MTLFSIAQVTPISVWQSTYCKQQGCLPATSYLSWEDCPYKGWPSVFMLCMHVRLTVTSLPLLCSRGDGVTWRHLCASTSQTAG